MLWLVTVVRSTPRLGVMIITSKHVFAIQILTVAALLGMSFASTRLIRMDVAAALAQPSVVMDGVMLVKHAHPAPRTVVPVTAHTALAMQAPVPAA